MHTPMPHAIASSTAHSLYTRCFVEMRATSDNMGMGPHAYTTSAPARCRTSLSTSVTFPRTPVLPSSVVMVNADANRFNSSTPNNLSSVEAPMTMSTRQPRSRRD